MLAALIGWGGTVLFDAGKTDWRIVVSPGAEEVEKYAAGELAAFLEKVSGANFEIVTTDEVPAGNAIVVGSVKTALVVKARAEALALTQGGEQKMAVYTLDGNLYLAGITPRGTLHAVYTFLQRELGIRWFWPETEPDGEFIPAKSRYELPKLSYNYEPPIRYRGYHFLNGTNYKLEQWLARNFGNIIRHGTAGGTERMAERRTLGYYLYISGHNVDPTSGLAKLDDIEKAMQEHPAWFAEVNGKRDKEHFCWNNAEVEDLVVKNTLQMIKDLPGIEILGFYPSDTQNYCTCPVCRKTDISTNWFKLVRRLSDRIRQVHPDIRFASIAYQGYLPYPKCDMRGYEFIEYALYERCYVHSLEDDCPVNKHALVEWSKWLNSGIATGIYGYEYDIFVPSMMVPLYSMIADQMRYFRSHGVVAVLPEVSGTWGGKVNGERVEARKDMRLAFYLYTQLMWDPGTDVDALIRDFCQYAYPSAAEEMYAYHTMMDRNWSSMKQHFTSYFNSPVSGAAELLSPDAVDKAFALFASAGKAMKGERELRALNFERAEFGRWMQYYWQNAPHVSLIPSGGSVSVGPGLTAQWSKGGVVIKADREITATYYRNDGTMDTRSGKELNFSDRLKAGDCRQLQVADTPMVILYCGGLEKVNGKALICVSGEPMAKNNAPKLRNVLMGQGWQIDFELAPLAPYDLVAVKINDNKLPDSFYRGELLTYVKNGGTAILSAEGNIRFEQLFGNADFRLNWTGKQEYAWKLRMTQQLEPGPWLNTPDDLEKSLKRLCTPTSGYEIPDGSKWCSLATMRKKDASTAPYILEMKYGRGRIILTTGSIGLGNDGAWMTFGSSHPESVVALFNNLAASRGEGLK